MANPVKMTDVGLFSCFYRIQRDYSFTKCLNLTFAKRPTLDLFQMPKDDHRPIAKRPKLCPSPNAQNFVLRQTFKTLLSPNAEHSAFATCLKMTFTKRPKLDFRQTPKNLIFANTQNLTIAKHRSLTECESYMCPLIKIQLVLVILRSSR